MAFMWGLVKFIIVVLAVVLLAQFLFAFISEVLESNPNVKGGWQASTFEEEGTLMSIPRTTGRDFWDWVPRPVYNAFMTTRANVESVFRSVAGSAREGARKFKSLSGTPSALQ